MRTNKHICQEVQDLFSVLSSVKEIFSSQQFPILVDDQSLNEGHAMERGLERKIGKSPSSNTNEQAAEQSKPRRTYTRGKMEQ